MSNTTNYKYENELISVTDSKSDYEVQNNYLFNHKLSRLKSETEVSRQPNEESNFNSSINNVEESECELDLADRVVKDQLNKDDDKKMTGY